MPPAKTGAQAPHDNQIRAHLAGAGREDEGRWWAASKLQPDGSAKRGSPPLLAMATHVRSGAHGTCWRWRGAAALLGGERRRRSVRAALLRLVCWMAHIVH